MFHEPPRSPGDLNFRLLGIPIRINPMFWIMALLLGIQREPWGTVIWMAAVLVSVVLHELGHAAVIRSMGFHPWIVLHGFGGLTIHNPGEAWGRPPTRLGNILISLAGPGAGFLLAVLVVAGVKATGYGDRLVWYGFRQLVPGVILVNYQVSMFISDVLQVCVMWGLLNLLPIFPLDGGQITVQVLSAANPRDGMRQSLILSVLVAGILAATAIFQWNAIFAAMMFGYLAYSSYSTLQGHGSW
jgi:stage IV sporulation protein FB